MTFKLNEILEEPKTKELMKTTSIRLPASMAQRLLEIAKAQRMTRTKLLRKLIGALIADYEEEYGTKRR